MDKKSCSFIALVWDQSSTFFMVNVYQFNMLHDDKYVCRLVIKGCEKFGYS